MRVGGTTEIPVDIRVLAATNKDLKGEVEQGNFRQDLYYRINVVTLHVPTLAERQDDIPLLCQHFLGKFAEAQGKTIDQIADEVMDVLLRLRIPREYPGVGKHHGAGRDPVQRGVIEMQHLPLDFQQPHLPGAAPPAAGIPYPGRK